MPRHSAYTAVLDGGVAKVFHRLHDGDWAYETVQDCDPILDLNKETANHHEGNVADWGKLTHRIPLIMFDKWQRELGIDYWNPDHADAVERLLASSDYEWLRATKKNSNVSYSGITIGKEAPVFQAPKVDKTKVLASDGTPMVAS